MANRYPLIVDTSDNNKIKELPSGDNLNLSGSGIVNAASITVNGLISTQSLTVNGASLSTVATTGDYNDLLNTPIAFSGSYNDLTNRPTIPTSTRTLDDVQNIEPENGDALIYNSVAGRYEPTPISTSFDIGSFNLDALNNVITPGDSTNKFLKYYSGAWRAANVTWGEVQNAPTSLSQFTNDVGYITAETDSQTLSFDNGTLTISNGNSIDISAMDLKGSVFADDSSLLVDATNSKHFGTFVGTLNGEIVGSVFADDSSVMVDAINREIVSDKFSLSAGDIISSANDITITGDQEGGVRIKTLLAPISIKNSETANGLNSITIDAGSTLNLVSLDGMTIRSGPISGPLTDIDMDARNVALDCTDFNITASSEVTISGEMNFAGNASTFRLPVYPDEATRDSTVTNPQAGMLVYVADIQKFTGYVDDAGLGFPDWVDLNV